MLSSILTINITTHHHRPHLHLKLRLHRHRHHHRRHHRQLYTIIVCISSISNVSDVLVAALLDAVVVAP